MAVSNCHMLNFLKGVGPQLPRKDYGLSRQGSTQVHKPEDVSAALSVLRAVQAQPAGSSAIGDVALSESANGGMIDAAWTRNPAAAVAGDVHASPLLPGIKTHGSYCIRGTSLVAR